MILSAALLFRHTYKDETAAQSIESAVQKVLASGVRTRDLVLNGEEDGLTIVGTQGMADKILAEI